MNPLRTDEAACPSRGTGTRRSLFLPGIFWTVCALLAFGIAPAACGGSGTHQQGGAGIASGGGPGSSGSSIGTGGATGLGGAAGGSPTGGVGGAGGRSAGGGGAAGAGSGGAAGAAGGVGGAGAAGGAGGAGGSSACASAVANAPCSTDNLTCGGPCTDICQFCNLLVCTGGHWQNREAAPAPCFSCGPDLKCQRLSSYCQTASGGPVGAPTTYGCHDLPAACVSAPTCSCLATANVMGSCTQGTDGSLTTQLQYP